jgi:poly-gamma-glutamate synthesis protein (capsule biosynthesis protein)
MLWLAGDVMTGRGIDQILVHPNAPDLYESYVRDARDYVSLAERVSGVVPRRVDGAYPWGDALGVIDRHAPDARIVNLETSVTSHDERWPNKAVHYRMHPRNVSVLTAARVDCCTAANNHILDWGRAGLIETLATLHGSGIATAGAGRNVAEAEVPAILPVATGRVLVFGVGSSDSGIPAAWRATPERSGVVWIDELSSLEVGRIADRVRAVRRPNDIVVVSIHWGRNWGYEIPDAHAEFAHGLIDRAGVDIVHGHSSHHPMPLEIHRGRLVLYGAGDLLNDYEGIEGHAEYQPGLGFLYFASLHPANGALERLELVPTRVRRFRLELATADEAKRLFRALDDRGWRGATATLRADGVIEVVPS